MNSKFKIALLVGRFQPFHKGHLYLIKKPVLVVWGENDKITPLREGELIAKTIRGAKLKVIKRKINPAPVNAKGRAKFTIPPIPIIPTFAAGKLVTSIVKAFTIIKV